MQRAKQRSGAYAGLAGLHASSSPSRHGLRPLPLRPGARVPGDRQPEALLRAVHRRRVRRSPRRRPLQDREPVHAGGAGRGQPRPGRPTSTGPCSAARRAQEEVWGRCPARSGRSTSSASPASSRSAPASWRCSRAWTTASRSRSPATSTSPWPRRTSSTTPAGRTSSSTPVSAPTRGPSGSPGRSSPGTSRC